MIKNVDGKDVECSADEEAQILADWATPPEEQVSPLKALLADPASLAEIKKALGL